MYDLILDTVNVFYGMLEAGLMQERFVSSIFCE